MSGGCCTIALTSICWHDIKWTQQYRRRQPAKQAGSFDDLTIIFLQLQQIVKSWSYLSTQQTEREATADLSWPENPLRNQKQEPHRYFAHPWAVWTNLYPFHVLPNGDGKNFRKRYIKHPPLSLSHGHQCGALCPRHHTRIVNLMCFHKRLSSLVQVQESQVAIETVSNLCWGLNQNNPHNNSHELLCNFVSAGLCFECTCFSQQWTNWFDYMIWWFKVITSVITCIPNVFFEEKIISLLFTFLPLLCFILHCCEQCIVTMAIHRSHAIHFSDILCES